MTSLEIAGVPLVLRGAWDRLGGLLEQLRRYRVDGPADRPVTVVLSEEQDAPRGAPVTLERDGAWLTADPDACTLRIGGLHGAASVERLLMHGFAAVLAARGALLVHAAAVDGPGGAIAFLGPAEAGKTTAAMNCPARMVHPDRVALGATSGGCWVAPVPFLYDEPRTGSVGPVELARLVVVQKAGPAANTLRAVPARHRLRQLCASVLMPPDPRLAALALEVAERVVRSVPFHVLEARLEGGFWPLLTAGESPVASTQEPG